MVVPPWPKAPAVSCEHRDQARGRPALPLPLAFRTQPAVTQCFHPWEAFFLFISAAQVASLSWGNMVNFAYGNEMFDLDTKRQFWCIQEGPGSSAEACSNQLQNRIKK